MQTLSDEQRRDMTPLKLRRKARDFALKTIKSQMAGFKRCAWPGVGCMQPWVCMVALSELRLHCSACMRDVRHESWSSICCESWR